MSIQGSKRDFVSDKFWGIYVGVCGGVLAKGNKWWRALELAAFPFFICELNLDQFSSSFLIPDGKGSVLAVGCVSWAIISIVFLDREIHTV